MKLRHFSGRVGSRSGISWGALGWLSGGGLIKKFLFRNQFIVYDALRRVCLIIRYSG